MWSIYTVLLKNAFRKTTASENAEKNSFVRFVNLIFLFRTHNYIIIIILIILIIKIIMIIVTLSKEGSS